MRRIGPAFVGALVLLAVAALATMGLRWVRHQRGLRERLTARDAIHAQIRGVILNQGVLKMAARLGNGLGNQALAHCILPQEPFAEPCRVTAPDEQQSFSMPESQDEDSPLIVGDVEHPARYSSTGAIGCKEGSSECPGWLVTAWFWADCPGKATECATAEALHVRFIVEGAGPMAAMPSNPADEAFRASTDAFAEIVTISAGGSP